MTNKEILNKINEIRKTIENEVVEGHKLYYLREPALQILNEATVQVNKGNKLREAEKMIQQVEKLWNN